MRLSVDMTGTNELLAQLRRLGGKADLAMRNVITDIVQETRAEAVEGIAGPPKSGVVYQKYIPRRTHQASAPGQYPAQDTGRLMASIKAIPPTASRLEGMVGTNLVYGLYLEFGTSRMAARPWLFPSFAKAKIGVEKRMKDQFESAAIK
jgi:phage gpG-like protein